ncbi:tRNA-dihydrouridine(47) synthase [NAD(P)(+)] [Rhizodiscina lignyota]|uniref:tRNA-dihydrouridine(47) synthase [NAD(P)(+)] n=1 Tax=Rhizodiscina lignyota TaxID=1504668 RepID=A0A9P4IM49_9PEZI|nr:tRNA-dihydrouridine(47) synthase [NAD(P)(+)] [Rhizodiscina lignyota]
MATLGEADADASANSPAPVVPSKRPWDQDVAEDPNTGTIKAEKVEAGDIDTPHMTLSESNPRSRDGVARVKKEFLIATAWSRRGEDMVLNDDAAEASRHGKQDEDGGSKGKKNRGQNKNRTFGVWKEEKTLCATRMLSPEFSPKECKFGDKCKFEHDLRKYLERKEGDLSTFDGDCPIWEAHVTCPAGWKCRFAGSHSKEVEREDGRSELVLLKDEAEDEERKRIAEASGYVVDELGLVNIVSTEAKFQLSRNQFKMPKSDQRQRQENRASYTEPPFLPSEKRRIYYGPETPVLAPLTTQGNLPFRRVCVSLGAQVTWSEMAMGRELLHGQPSEWALIKAHTSELSPPRFFPSEDRTNSVVEGYDNAKDSKFGVQIAANKPWLAMKATEVLTALCPHIRAIDLNCGCPIETVCRTGAGSALLEHPAKLEQALHGMNLVSNEVPVTAKLRMGWKKNDPNAEKLIKRLVLGGYEAMEKGAGPSGVAAITLHGRDKPQRYTKAADWSYIAECSAMINRLQKDSDAVADTAGELDDRYKPNGGKVYFVGNGDCYSQVDYYDHIKNAKVDSVMVARGALVKPWIFEEIETNQYLDKSASERLEYIKKFVQYGLETWGSDQLGVNTTRRFLLEWLSFSCRYVPIGILEYLPPKINERPPAFKGRDELETLLSSGNYKDWIKISEMFLGPPPPGFEFKPKHKSNSYDVEG